MRKLDEPYASFAEFMRSECDSGYSFDTMREKRSSGEHVGVEYVPPQAPEFEPVGNVHSAGNGTNRRPYGYTDEVLFKVLVLGHEHVEQCASPRDASAFASALRTRARKGGVVDRVVVRRMGGSKVSVRLNECVSD